MMFPKSLLMTIRGLPPAYAFSRFNIPVLLHDGLARYPHLTDAVAEYVGNNFLKMMSSMEDSWNVGDNFHE